MSLELFASGFRHLQILGSSKYPTEMWRLLGEAGIRIMASPIVPCVHPPKGCPGARHQGPASSVLFVIHHPGVQSQATT